MEKKIITEEVEIDLPDGPIPKVIEELRRLHEQYPQASLYIGSSGYDAPMITLTWTREETPAEEAARLLAERRAQIEEEKRRASDVERKKRHKQYLKLKEEFG